MIDKAYFALGIVIAVLYGLLSGDFPAPKHIFDEVDPEFAPYVTSFEETTGVSAAGIAIQFGKLREGVLGTAYPYPLVPEIIIQKEAWSRLRYSREFLVWHELAHLLCHKKHVEGEMKDGCPISIMNAYIGSELCYLEYREHYIELFKLECQPFIDEEEI
jgi:hypothetical protein